MDGRDIEARTGLVTGRVGSKRLPQLSRKAIRDAGDGMHQAPPDGVTCKHLHKPTPERRTDAISEESTGGGPL